MDEKFLTIEQATAYINKRYSKSITSSNVNYLIKYGQLERTYINNIAHIKTQDIDEYYKKEAEKSENWKKPKGENLNWELSFDNVRESERTKHVHRLHPYKGKFIPQLVEYFIDDRINSLKKQVFFNKGDVIIDPFCRSGTTLVQANESGLHGLGIDISEFNALISNIKVDDHDLLDLQQSINVISKKIRAMKADSPWNKFDVEIVEEVSRFNKTFFPTPEILYKIKKGEINIDTYSKQKENEINAIFDSVLKQYELNLHEANHNGSFINKWFTPPVKAEIILILDQINKVKNDDTKNVLKLILSRTVRSCRATTHSDLATLIEPQMTPYYCMKHNKICKPLFSLQSWWEFYTQDTIKRFLEFSKLRTNTLQTCLTGDSRTINILDALNEVNKPLKDIISNKKAKGIFTSPPYVGMIDYHEQHAYAYELFNIQRRDELEISPLSKGKGIAARTKYVEDISNVLINMKNYLVDNSDIFIVANDSYNLYPRIAEKSNLIIAEVFQRPVLNRTEKDKSSYSEKIFHLKLS